MRENSIGKVLSLKYRPQTFDEIKAQDHIKETLTKAIANRRIANAYLFCGPRGIGKTTTARILAKSLNCQEGITDKPCGKCRSCKEIALSRSIDVLEIDGASNRGIDEVKNLRENVKYAPVLSRFKIYIIDEVHMLTTEAFNALLKTLEEPPPHVKFIFATTAPHKVPKTIISRCQRFDFRKAHVLEIAARLREIAEKEGIKIEEDALLTIARRSEGAIRDGEVILDQIATYADRVITKEKVEEILNIIPEETFFSFFQTWRSNDVKEILSFIAHLGESGYDPIEFFSGLVKFFRTLLLVKYGLSCKTLELSQEDYERFQKDTDSLSPETIDRILDTLIKYEEPIRRSFFPEILLEMIALEINSIGQKGLTTDEPRF